MGSKVIRSVTLSLGGLGRGCGQGEEDQGKGEDGQMPHDDDASLERVRDPTEEYSHRSQEGDVKKGSVSRPGVFLSIAMYENMRKWEGGN